MSLLPPHNNIITKDSLFINENQIELPSHNKKYCYIEENNIIEDNNIDNKIKSILSNPNYLNNIPLLIKTNKKEYRTSIVSRYNNNILTLNNEIIPVSEIISIEVI